ncbi:MAG: hypothetical protein LW709_08215 [Oxalobacteraceae bacterium]|nr:hypothetical protein [Oxalobacteraceae bacterium]
MTSPVKMWTRQLSSSTPLPTQTLATGLAVTTGVDGAIYVGGFALGAFDGQANSGGYDGFLTKYNADGTKAWSKLLGTSLNEQATCLTTGLDGAIYIGGNTYGALDGQTNSGDNDAFLTKYNPDGTKVWTRLLGSAGGEAATSLTTGLDGAIYVGGHTSGALDGQTNSGSGDAFLTKYSTDGTKAWTKLLGTSGSEINIRITSCLDGEIYVGGTTTGALDGQTNSGSGDVFLTKYNADGTKAWTKLLGSSQNEDSGAITTGLDGAIYIGGTTMGSFDGQTNSGSGDVFLTKYDPDGTKAWTKLLGSAGGEAATSLTTGLDGAIYVGGYTTAALDGQTNSGSADGFLTKYNPDGTKVWTELLGSNWPDYTYALTTGIDGTIYAAQDRVPTNPWNIYVSDVYLVKYREAADNSATITTIVDTSDSSSSYGLYKMSSGSYTVAEFGLDPDAVPVSPMLMAKDSKGTAWTTAATTVAINYQTNAKTNAKEIAVFTITGTGAKTAYAEEIFAISTDRTKLTSTTAGKAAALTSAQAIAKELNYGQDFNGDGVFGAQAIGIKTLKMDLTYITESNESHSNVATLIGSGMTNDLWASIF